MVVGIRARKNHLIVLVKAHLLARKLTTEEANGFESMYRRCRSEREQDEVTMALHQVVEGWKDPGKGAAGGAIAHLQRLRAGIDLYSDDVDEDPPALRAALARARVNVRRGF
jgi:hypothetical protein